jgi:tRNA pseudouridine13 synthase
LPRAYGIPPVSGRLRERDEDFEVIEELGFEPDGQGEHGLLWVRKRGANTEWVARQLAAHAGLPASAVGYAGLKDRRALTSQWFSVQLPGRPDPDWGAFAVPGVEILATHRHRRKLQRGALRGNRFVVRVRGLAGDRDALCERLERVRGRGVPNYFGPQRFGHEDGNLHAAGALFAGKGRRVDRHRRGLWLSAVRSQLFNEVLALRVARGDWDQVLAGDRLQLRGSRSHFAVAEVDELLRERALAFDVDPTGPLCGAGEALVTREVAELEALVLACFPEWVSGLVAAGMRQERRPLRLAVGGLRSEPVDTYGLVLAFSLPAGVYATAVLRELIDWTEPQS